MSRQDMEAEIVAELRRVVGEDEAHGSAFVVRARPGVDAATAAAEAAALLARLRALPSAIGHAELRRRLGAAGA